VDAYRTLVLLDHVDPGTTVKQALAIYKKFHVLNRQPTWGQVPFSCSCRVCICQETILLAALFDPKERVPADMVSATVSARKQGRPIAGTAGRKRLRLEEERVCNEKAIHSKVRHLKASAPAKSVVVPPPEDVVMPSSDDESLV
jgi:hypothetical protein